MEPMNLGSPSGSPAQGTLPGYLMGDPVTASAATKTTFSPIKKTLPFAASPNSTQDFSFNRSSMASPVGPQGQAKFARYHASAADTSSSAPPTIGLFDSLREERNQTPSKPLGYTAIDGTFNSSNVSRIVSPFHNSTSMYCNESSTQQNQLPYSNFWITIFGFPPTNISTVLSHFSQCGTIVDKAFSPQNGNWIHLRFSSRMECDKALNFNGKIIANSIMIGVLPCTDTSVTNEETIENRTEPSKLRSLSRVTYETSQTPTAVEPSIYAPKMNNSLVSKAMDLVFGW